MDGLQLPQQVGQLAQTVRVRPVAERVLGIFVGFEKDGVDENGRTKGRFLATGVRPNFMTRLEAAGVRLPASAFRQRVMMED